MSRPHCRVNWPGHVQRALCHTMPWRKCRDKWMKEKSLPQRSCGSVHKFLIGITAGQITFKRMRYQNENWRLLFRRSHTYTWWWSGTNQLFPLTTSFMISSEIRRRCIAYRRTEKLTWQFTNDRFSCVSRFLSEGELRCDEPSEFAWHFVLESEIK